MWGVYFQGQYWGLALCVALTWSFRSAVAVVFSQVCEGPCKVIWGKWNPYARHYYYRQIHWHIGGVIALGGPRARASARVGSGKNPST